MSCCGGPAPSRANPSPNGLRVKRAAAAASPSTIAQLRVKFEENGLLSLGDDFSCIVHTSDPLPAHMQNQKRNDGADIRMYKSTYDANAPNEDRYTCALDSEDGTRGTRFMMAGVWDGHGTPPCLAPGRLAPKHSVRILSWFSRAPLATNLSCCLWSAACSRSAVLRVL